MKDKITVKSSDRVRCTSSSVHHETKVKSTVSAEGEEKKDNLTKKPAEK